MTYAFTQDVPGDAALWAQVEAEIGDRTPDGLVVHVVAAHEGGLRHVGVWEDEDAWASYRTHVLEPAVDRVMARFGVTDVDHSRVVDVPIDVVDVLAPAR